MVYPDFIGIGAQKAGTTWLYYALAEHPDLWLPPLKELHYFNHAEATRRELLGRFVGQEPRNRRWRRTVRLRLAEHVEERSLAGLPWDLRFFFGRRDDRWYGRLFEPGRGRMVGEITPDYSRLGPAAVARVAQLVPDARILYFLRHPVERAWSGAVMFFTKRRGVALRDVDDERLERHLRAAMNRSRTAYLRTIQRWQRHYPPERIFVGFLEDIAFHPDELLAALCSFLGVQPRRATTAMERINPGASALVPARVAATIARVHLDDLAALATRFEGYPRLWLDSARRLLEVPPDAGELSYPYWTDPTWGAGGRDEVAALGLRSASLATLDRGAGRGA